LLTLRLRRGLVAHPGRGLGVGEFLHGLAGFGWHQGWNDRISDSFNAEYESNVAHFIRDMRKDLGVPALPFVIAETGMNGPEEKHPRALSLMKAQAAVAERPEFKGNVAFVGTKAFWRPAEESPSAQGYHWNSNAETYYLIGEAMGEATRAAFEDAMRQALLAATVIAVVTATVVRLAGAARLLQQAGGPKRGRAGSTRPIASPPSSTIAAGRISPVTSSCSAT
jgi:hypothetical protein